MNRLHFETTSGIRNLAGSDWEAIQESDSGAALDVVRALSKILVAYVEGLIAMTRYSQGLDVHASGLADLQIKTYPTSRLFNTINSAKWKEYLMHKLSKWLEDDCPCVVEPELRSESRKAAEGTAQMQTFKM